jgi:hypothetical protein
MCIDPSFLGPWVEERWPHGVIDFPLFDCTPFLVYAYDFLYKKKHKTAISIKFRANDAQDSWAKNETYKIDVLFKCI